MGGLKPHRLSAECAAHVDLRISSDRGAARRQRALNEARQFGGTDCLLNYSHHPQTGSKMFWLLTGGRVRLSPGTSGVQPKRVCVPAVYLNLAE